MISPPQKKKTQSNYGIIRIAARVIKLFLKIPLDSLTMVSSPKHSPARIGMTKADVWH